MMTQEEKELLLKDLCARLPYGVKVQHQRQDYLEEIQTIEQITRKYVEIETESVLGFVDDFKPYLRPLSSMTEEERTEIDKLNRPPGGDWVVQLSRGNTGLYNNFSRVVQFKSINKVLDYLNAHHFDYRGLIEKSLAIEAPEGMYNINEK